MTTKESMHKTEKTYGAFDSKLNRKLLTKLEDDGKVLFKFPEVLKEEVKITPAGNAILKNMQNYDWLIISDVFAVDFFIELLKANNLDLYELDNLRICAYGEAVADRLRFVQIHADVIADRIDDGLIFKQLAEYIFDVNEFVELEVLFVQVSDKKYKIIEKLTDANSNITVFETYQNQLKEKASKLKLLLTNGAVDEFIFFNPDEVFDLATIFSEMSLNEVLQEVKVRANNESTFQTLREYGLKPNFINKKRG